MKVLNKIPTPEVLPAEPEVLPDQKPQVQPVPREDDPFNVPAPKVDPTPKGVLI